MSIQSKSILIENKILFYNEIELLHGRGYLDRLIARENLKIFCSIVENSNLKYGLFFGTLLGAIRENNFIEHDEDTDIYMLYEERESFLKLLFEFENKELKVVRLDKDMVSLMRKDEYIDVYFFRIKYKFGIKRLRVYSNETEYPALGLENPVKRDFLGIEVSIPSNSVNLLERMYGKNWQIPIKGQYAPANTFYKKFASAMSGLEKFPAFKELRYFTRVIFKFLGL